MEELNTWPRDQYTGKGGGRSTLKGGGLSTLKDGGASTLKGEAAFEYIPVLLYHGIVEEPDNANVFWKDFIEQMEALKKAGYQTIDSEELAGLLNGEDIGRYNKPIMISFDDGRKDSYYYSDFIFKELDFKAVMFVIIDKQIDNDPSFSSWEELKQISESGR